jgi:hypothetical protein
MFIISKCDFTFLHNMASFTSNFVISIHEAIHIHCIGLHIQFSITVFTSVVKLKQERVTLVYGPWPEKNASVLDKNAGVLDKNTSVQTLMTGECSYSDPNCGKTTQTPYNTMG